MQTRTAALLTIFACALAGCGNSADQSASTGTSPTAQGAGGAKLKIVYIPKNTGNPYFDEVNKGFEAACKADGDEFSTTGPATADATSQIPIIKDQMQRGVDIIALSPNSADALDQVLDAARAKGITVVTVDSDLTGHEAHRDAAVIPTGVSDVGSGQIELMSQLIGGAGDIAILSARTDAPNQNAWIANMKEVLKDPRYSKIHLIDTVYGDDEPQKSSTECEALISKYPSLRGIISPTSVGLAAGAQVVQQQGVYPGGAHANGAGLELTGLSTPNQMRRFVDKGVVKKFQLWSAETEGYLAAYIGHQIKAGKLKPAKDTEIDVPTVGKRKFGDNMIVTGGPLVTFDSTNIAKFNF